MSYQQASPICFVDVYPSESASISLPQAALISVNVSKNIGQDMGTFQLNLVPGGPNGLNQPPSWAQLITPMSFVVITMSRGDNTEIVMLGIVQSVTEAALFQPEASVQRVIQVT